MAGAAIALITKRTDGEIFDIELLLRSMGRSRSGGDDSRPRPGEYPYLDGSRTTLSFVPEEASSFMPGSLRGALFRTSAERRAHV